MRISDWSSDVCSSDLALLERPALLDRVRADRTLVPKVINEGMRWETASQFLARQATVDVEIRGVKIPAGAAVSLASGSANRDEDIFDNPDEFDIDRPAKVNLGFGGGAHLCLGIDRRSVVWGTSGSV